MILIRIRSEYFENDSSRYRLGITQNTLIPSLKAQTDQDFSIAVTQSPMDPYFTKRQKLFNTVNSAKKMNFTEPLVEVIVGDDDFLSPKFIETLRKVPLQRENSFLSFPNGYIFCEGKLKVWRGREDLVQVTMFVDNTGHVGRAVEVTQEPSWIYVRHNMNTIQIPPGMISGQQVIGLKWKGWKESITAKYCAAEIKMASSFGCTLEPGKSKSMTTQKKSVKAGRRR